MNEIDPPPTGLAELRERAAACNRLMLEYTEKLMRWNLEAAALNGRIATRSAAQHEIEEWSDLRGRYLRVREACADLSSITSGLIEQSRLESIDRTELRLRLAEFETEWLKYQAHFPDRYDVSLDAVKSILNMTQVTKVIREVTGQGSSEARTLVENLPKPVKKRVPRAEAEAIKRKLEEVGGKVSLHLI